MILQNLQDQNLQDQNTPYLSTMSDISVYITSDLTSSERRISPQWDLHHLKHKLELITGIPPRFQTIQYYTLPNSNEYQTLSDASQYNEARDRSNNVSALNIVSYGRLHIVDTNPDSDLKDLEDNPNQAEFKLSDTEYAKRSDSVLRWKKNNQLGRFNPEYQEEKALQITSNIAASQKLQVGNRCRVISIGSERRGVVKFVGKIQSLDDGENVWVGIEFDEPTGKNNGYIDGVKIFECKEKHGSFVKPKQVEVGDFPELDPFASDEEEL